MPDAANPCQQCGACCAMYRVSFYWAEAADFAESLVEQISPVRACMRGTNQAAPRCNALTGHVGESVSCSIYAQRPSPCREVEPGDDKCVRARARHGLAPLDPLHTTTPEHIATLFGAANSATPATRAA